MRATLYISPHCFLCKWVEPAVQAWFARRGLDLAVFKLRNGVATQVNGERREAVTDVPAVPALALQRDGSPVRVVVVGAGILGVLRHQMI